MILRYVQDDANTLTLSGLVVKALVRIVEPFQRLRRWWTRRGLA